MEFIMKQSIVMSEVKLIISNPGGRGGGGEDEY